MKKRSILLIGSTLFLAQVGLVASSTIGSVDPDTRQKIYAGFSDSAALPLLLAGLAWYVGIGIATHTLPMLIASRMGCDISRHLQTRTGKPTLPALPNISCGLAVILLFALNFIEFPESRCIGDLDLLFTQNASNAVIIGLLTLWCTAALYWVVIATKLVQTLVVGSVLLIALALSTPIFSGDRTARERPDVIVIGVDSLRTDHLAAYGARGSMLTPTIDDFLSHATIFERAYTPQARTSVAYTSMLTGLYPTSHGARENLYPARQIRHDTSIALSLRDIGYSTVFAMDESRFANIGPEFGFDRMVAPPHGIMDFLLGSALDTAGTNLLQLVPYLNRLIPHLAGNRAAANIYRPDVFSRELAEAIRSQDTKRPLLLVAHFCISHWPYAVSTSHPAAAPGSLESSPAIYRNALQIADNQVDSLMSTLKESGRLQNALVIFISDHGEALGLPRDRWDISAPTGITILPVTLGHGTPALDTAQTRVVMGFQRYRDGEARWGRVRYSPTVSLIDVAPTVLSLVGVNMRSRVDGVALLDGKGSLRGGVDRPVFVESGLSGVAIQKAKIDAGEAVAQFSGMYEVTPDGRLEMTADGQDLALEVKQRAVIYGNEGVSSWPTRDGAGCWLSLDVVYKSGRCVPLSDVTSPPRMSDLLCKQFRNDRAFVAKWCSPRSVSLN